MMDIDPNLLNKLIILDYSGKKPFICWLREITPNSIKIESPTAHQVSYIDRNTITQVGPLPTSQIRPEKVNR